MDGVMYRVWPHFPEDAALSAYQRVRSGEAIDTTEFEGRRTWPAVGSRVDADTIDAFVAEIRAAAERFGFPSPTADRDKVAFDRAVTRILRSHVRLPYGEAGSAETWAYITFVLLPEETAWRFDATRERWLYSSSGVRHAWARLWWQAEALDDRFDVLDALSESELIPLFERTGISGCQPLIRTAFGAYLALDPADRRLPLLRDFAKRLSRMLAFVEPGLLDAAAMRALVGETLEPALRQWRSRGDALPLKAPPIPVTPLESSGSAEDEGAHEPPELLRQARGILQPYSAFAVPAGMPPLTRMNGRAAQALVLAAVRLEGPVLPERLERCILGDDIDARRNGCGALTAAIESLTESSLLKVAMEDSSEPVLTVRGSARGALRRRGARTFEEIPESEVRAAAGLTSRVFELFDVLDPTPSEEARLGRILDRLKLLPST